MYSKKFWDSVYSKHFADAPWMSPAWTKKGLEQTTRFIPADFKGRILDYGCGNATVSKYYMKRGSQVDLAEISSTMIDWLRSEYQQYGCNIFDVFTPAEIQVDYRYDFIFALGVFHHIDTSYWREFLAAFYRLLSPGGVLLINGWDDDDAVLRSNEMKAPMTEEHAWTITKLTDYVNQDLFHILENESELITLYPFKKKRTLRSIALGK